LTPGRREVNWSSIYRPRVESSVHRAAALSLARRQVRRAQRRQGILDAAARVFREVGYERATLEAIGQAVGLSKASLYYYVRSKEELLGRLLAEVIDAIAERAGQGLPLRASAVVCEDPKGALLGRHQDVVLGEAHSRFLREARRRHERRLEEILEQGVAEGVFRPLPTRTVTYLVLGALNSVARWHDRVPGATPSAIAEALCSMVLEGVRARPRSPSRRRVDRAG
jgi:AcrR family transcriptional regulator